VTKQTTEQERNICSFVRSRYRKV